VDHAETVEKLKEAERVNREIQQDIANIKVGSEYCTVLNKINCTSDLLTYFRVKQ
jgi:hypothetical protein